MKSNYKINPSTGLKIFLLLGFAIFYFYIIMSGAVKQYVHPRMIPYMIFAAIVMLIIAGLLFGQLFKKQHGGKHVLPLFFFLIPLMLAFVLPARTFYSTAGTTAGIDLSVGQAEAGNADTGAQGGDEAQNDVIVMNSTNFYKCLCDINDHLDEYEGKQIDVIGFVFKDNSFAENEFVPARFMMVCCAADMVPVGLMCRYSETKSLEKDTWVRVRGTLHKGEFQGQTMPTIEVSSVEDTEKPASIYIYPY